MSFHFCSRSWEVSDLPDATLVKLSNRDLNEESVPVLVDDLVEVAMESGRANLQLDFSGIRFVASVIPEKLLELDAKLREHGGRLVVLHLDPQLYETFQATRLTEVLDIRPEAVSGSVA
jgi:anti-anti-sigma factor